MGCVAIRSRTCGLGENGPCLAGEPVPITAATPKGLQRREEGGTAQPDVRLPHPPVQDGISASPSPCVQALHQRTHNVNGQRIDECTQPSRPDKTFDARQVRIPEKTHCGLKENHRGQAALKNGHRPKLGTQRGDVVMRQVRVPAKGIADGSPHRSHRGAVELQGAGLKIDAMPEAHLVGPVPRPFALKGKVDKLASLTHPFILYVPTAERLIP